MADRATAVIAYDGAELLDIACITTPLALANMIGRPRDPYRVQVLSLDAPMSRAAVGES